MIDTVFALFDRNGDERYGEGVTQREHALQTAWCARAAGESDAMIAAALLHDVGQLLGDAGRMAEQQNHDARHEINGASFLAGFFPEAVLAPIRMHVAAKRHLCAVEPTYFEGLSGASRLSLSLQGGPFSLIEAKNFAAHPFAAEALRLRRYDDGGKAIDVAVPDLEPYGPLLARVRL